MSVRGQKTVTINKTALFMLMQSHSALSQAEYERNKAYNDSHPSAVAEQRIIAELDSRLINEYFQWLEEEKKQ